MKKTLIVIVLIVLMVGCVFYRYNLTKQSEQEQAQVIQQSMIPHVDVMEPLSITTSNVIEAPGRVVAVKSVDVIARVSGTILSQHYKDGDYVKQGQLLYKIDPTPFQIAVESAKANLESAIANQYQAQRDFERAQELVKKDFVSKSAYDGALAAKDAANAAVRANRAALADAARLLSYTRITAPISGKISLPVVTVGNYLSTPNTALTKIVSVNPIYVQYSLDSSLYNQLKNDEIIPNGRQRRPIKVEITLPDGSIYKRMGQADFSDNVISQTTGTITLRATFDNSEASLIPGDFVSVKVFSNKSLNKIAVPQSAVLQDSEGKYLFVVDEENVAHKRKIETEGQNDNNWLVSSGITKGEKFVSTGVIGVRDGVKVAINDSNEDEKADEQKEVEKIEINLDEKTIKANEDDAFSKYSQDAKAENEQTQTKEKSFVDTAKAQLIKIKTKAVEFFNSVFSKNKK